MSVPSEEKFVAVLRPHLRFLAPGAPVDWERSLKDLGLNSLSSVNLLVDLEEAFDLTFSDDQLAPESFATARTLWKAVSGGAGPA
ncbi:MAG: hypothetical protein K1X89_10005 [Myxococcaceae bacterium]|nr:hypothetical protein [Myxococcaceae bacterium]